MSWWETPTKRTLLPPTVITTRFCSFIWRLAKSFRLSLLAPPAVRGWITHAAKKLNTVIISGSHWTGVAHQTKTDILKND